MKKKLVLIISIICIFAVVGVLLMSSLNAGSTIYEAESSNNKLKYAEINGDFVEFQAKKDAYVEMKDISVSTGGEIELTFYYTSNESFPLELKVNGNTICKKDTISQNNTKVTYKANMNENSESTIRFKIRAAVEGIKLDKVVIGANGEEETVKSEKSDEPKESTLTETATPDITVSTITSTIERSPTNSKVACIGDSITQGWGDDYTVPYPEALQNLLGSNYTVKNYGVSGSTMLKKGNKPYWNTSQYKDSSNWLPGIVIIMLGSNDAKSYNWEYKSEFLANSVEMINHYKNLDSHPIVYVATSPTVYNGTSGNYGITNQIVTGEVVPLTKQASKETGCALIDVNTATQGMPQSFPDYVHPNDDGHLVIAKAVFNIIGK